jgi:hypothetical protein
MTPEDNEQKERVIEQCEQLENIFGTELFSAMECILGDDFDAMESALQDYL